MPSDDDWRPSCWDCGREAARRDLQPHPVHIDHEDGIGYEVVDVPLCGPCRRSLMPTHECEYCGEEYIDITDAVECCQHRRGRPMPDGGREDHSVAVERAEVLNAIDRVADEVANEDFLGATREMVAEGTAERIRSEVESLGE